MDNIQVSQYIGLSIDSPIGPIMVPREVEAQGMPAVASYVAERVAKDQQLKELRPKAKQVEDNPNPETN